MSAQAIARRRVIRARTQFAELRSYVEASVIRVDAPRVNSFRPHLALSVMLCLSFVLPAQADLKKNTVQGFDRYVRVTEARIQKEEGPGGVFLSLDALPPGEKSATLQRLKNGEVVIDRLRTHDAGKEVEAPDGMVHHWRAVVFAPGATIQQALGVVQDYNNHSKAYAPDIERSKLLKREGDKFSIYYRVRRKKVVTVVMDTYYDVTYGPVMGHRMTSRSYSTRIQEVKSPGEANERVLPPDTGTGFMWRLYSYWRFEERDSGLYIQCEAVSLSRDIPTGLGWMIGPFVESVPRESLVFTLGKTRDQLLKTSAGRAAR